MAKKPKNKIFCACETGKVKGKVLERKNLVAEKCNCFTDFGTKKAKSVDPQEVEVFFDD